MADAEGPESRRGALDPRLPARGVLVGGIAGLVGGSYRLLLAPLHAWARPLARPRGGRPPERAGSGLPQVEASLARDAPLPRWHRLLPIKFVAGGLALGGGLSLGREGPAGPPGARAPPG